jgi:hypothetical protein
MSEPEWELTAHLEWLADRLVHKYGESPNADFVLATRRYAASVRHLRPTPGEPAAQPAARSARDIACEFLRPIQIVAYQGAGVCWIEGMPKPLHCRECNRLTAIIEADRAARHMGADLNAVTKEILAAYHATDPSGAFEAIRAVVARHMGERR